MTRLKSKGLQTVLEQQASSARPPHPRSAFLNLLNAIGGNDLDPAQTLLVPFFLSGLLTVPSQMARHVPCSVPVP